MLWTLWIVETVFICQALVSCDQGEYGDVSERKALRKRLQCKTFDWYIKNIYPSLFIPGEAMASGEVREYIHGSVLSCLLTDVIIRNLHLGKAAWFMSINIMILAGVLTSLCKLSKSGYLSWQTTTGKPVLRNSKQYKSKLPCFSKHFI